MEPWTGCVGFVYQHMALVGHLCRPVKHYSYCNADTSRGEGTGLSLSLSSGISVGSEVFTGVSLMYYVNTSNLNCCHQSVFLAGYGQLRHTKLS
jgi:hypothetical protein